MASESLSHLRCFSLVAPPLFVDVEHVLHHLPLLVGALSGFALLEEGHVVFPLCLAWAAGHLGHGLVPVEEPKPSASSMSPRPPRTTLHTPPLASSSSATMVAPYPSMWRARSSYPSSPPSPLAQALASPSLARYCSGRDCCSVLPSILPEASMSPSW